MPWDVEEHYMPYAVARPAGAGDVSAVLRYANGAYYNLLLQLKRTLDPKNILNRGNIEVAT
jgi:FAD/FMN-containing dehydrogenase